MDSGASCAGFPAEALVVVLNDTAALLKSGEQKPSDPDYALRKLLEFEDAVKLFGINANAPLEISFGCELLSSYNQLSTTGSIAAVTKHEILQTMLTT